MECFLDFTSDKNLSEAIASITSSGYFDQKEESEESDEAAEGEEEEEEEEEEEAHEEAKDAEDIEEEEGTTVDPVVEEVTQPAVEEVQNTEVRFG